MNEGFINMPRNRREWSLALMLLFYLAAGINHFRVPAFYLPLIPDYLPNKELLNTLSGLAEIGLALLLVWPATRRWAAWGIIAMLIAFLPAHFWFIQKGGCLDPHGLCVPVWVAWVRLLVVHPLLMWWAYACSKPTTASS
jgi:uncharacterized membrane protein